MRERDPRLVDGGIDTEPRTVEGESRLTIAEISELEGRPWTWVVRRIAPFKDQLDLTQEVRTLGELEVPRNVFVLIPFVSETDTPAGDWMTVSEIADRLSVEFKWVNRRILSLEAVGEWRLCYQINRPEFHLPPEASEELTEIRNQAIGQFEPGTHLNLAQISNMLGRHRLWVSNRLDDILEDEGIEPKLGLDGAGRAVEHYPKEVLEPLMEEKDKYEDSGDRLTIPMLAEEVGKDREWVERQLEDLNAEGNYLHFSKSGRIDLSFDRGILYELINRATTYVGPEPEWYTEHALIKIVGKSKNWVNGRLRQIDAGTRWFRDSRGVLRKHYPSAVLANLLGEIRGWRVTKALEFGEAGPEEDDTAGRFMRAVNSGITKNHRTLNKMGVVDTEIELWQREGLVTRWANGQYFFTKKGRLVAERIEDAERIAGSFLEERRLYME